MPIQHLVRHYDQLAENPDNNIPIRGFSNEKISFAIVLNKKGEIVDIEDLRVAASKGKKLIPTIILVPEKANRSSNIESSPLWENGKYALGLENSQDKFKDFKEKIMNILLEVDDEEAVCLKNFVNKHVVNKAADNPYVAKYLKDLSSTFMVFRMKGKKHYIHENKEVKEAYIQYYSEQNIEKGDEKCRSITGENDVIAVIHPKIKGVFNCHVSGGTVISYNNNAYESYGNINQKGKNALVGELATFKYSTMINRLISNGHNLLCGQTTMIHWSDTSSDFKYQEVFKRLLNFISNKELQEINEMKKELDLDVEYYVLGIRANISRLFFSSFSHNKFGFILENIEKNILRTSIENDYQKTDEPISFWSMLKALTWENKLDKTVLSDLAESLLVSIIMGQPYPRAILSELINLIKSSRKIPYIKAGMLKGYYLSDEKLSCKYKEVLNVKLNVDNQDTPYLLGRLFACLEIYFKNNNSYFANEKFDLACSCPARTFPYLLKKVKTIKADNTFMERDIEEIMGSLQGRFPQQLSIEQQGIFLLGYYHQRNWIFKGNKDKKEELADE